LHFILAGIDHACQGITGVDTAKHGLNQHFKKLHLGQELLLFISWKGKRKRSLSQESPRQVFAPWGSSRKPKPTPDIVDARKKFLHFCISFDNQASVLSMENDFR
jgi:hypothetical protein